MARKMLAVSEIITQEDGNVKVVDIFRFQQTNVSEEGRVEGHFTATGHIPTCLSRLKAYGVPVDPRIFTPVQEVARL